MTLSNAKSIFKCRFKNTDKVKAKLIVDIDLILIEGNIKNLLVWIKDNLLKERPELFIQGDTV